MKYKHGRHVEVSCLLKVGQYVTIDNEYHMAMFDGRRRQVGGLRVKILAITRDRCESGFMLKLSKDLTIDSNWVTV